MPAPWRVEGSPVTSRAALLRVAASVLAVKAYTLLLLYALSRQAPVREGYEPFLFLEEGQKREKRLEAIQASFLERLAPYDGQFYLDIASRGYRVFGKDDSKASLGPGGNYAFFPLYPLLVRGARAVVGPRGGLVVLLLANVALSCAAAVGLYCLALRLGLPPWPSVLFLVTFPTAAFQSALYTESLFLALSVGAALCATSGRCIAGAGLGYLAGLSRPQGMLVAALWAGELLRRGRASPGARRAWLRAFVAAAAPFAGVATFSLVLWHAIGAPLGFLGIQKHWGRELSASNVLREVFLPWTYEGPPFDLLAALLGVGLLPFLWRHLPRPLALFGTLSVAMPLATGTILSLGRFLSVSFPHFLCLAKLLERWPVARVTLLASFIVLQCLIAKGLVGWRFVG